MKFYGFLSYSHQTSNNNDKNNDNCRKVRFPLRKQTITIGTSKADDIVLKLPKDVGRCLQLSIRHRSSKDLDYILTICTDDEPILLNNNMVCRNQGEIILQHQDVISISKGRFKLLKNIKNNKNSISPSSSSSPIIQRPKIFARTSLKYQLIDIFSGSSKKTRNSLRSSTSKKKLEKSLVPKAVVGDTVIDNVMVPLIDFNDHRESLNRVESSAIISADQTTSDYVTAKTCLIQECLCDKSESNLQPQSNIVHVAKVDNEDDQSKNADSTIINEVQIKSNENELNKKNGILETEVSNKLIQECQTPPSASILKSALKTQSTGKLTRRKSVMFNEFVEENRSEYDRMTGRLFSSQKISKKLFPISPEKKDEDNKDELMDILVHFQPELGSKFKTPKEIPVKTYSSRQCNSSSKIKLDNLIPKPTKEEKIIDLSKSKNNANIRQSNTFLKDNPQGNGNFHLIPFKIEQSKTPMSELNIGIKKLKQPENFPANYNSDFGLKKLIKPETPKADDETNVDYGIKKLQQAAATPMADCESNVDYGVKKLQQSTTPIADYKARVNFGLKKLIEQETPKADYKSKVDYTVKKLQQPVTPMADYETNIDYGIKKLQQPATPMADYESNVDYGVKKLQQPMTPIADYESNVDFGLKKLTGPKTPKADYESKVDYAVKKLQQPMTPMADYETNIDYGIKKLQQPVTPMADYESNVDYGVKKLQQPMTPKADYESNVDFGLKKLTGPETPKADYESKVDYAVKKLQQPMTPMADYETNIDYGIKKLQQPATPMADYVSNVDYGVKKLQQSMTPKADYESNIDYGLKKLQQSTTPIADYESNVDFGLKKLTGPETPKADYESKVDYAVKKLQQPMTPMADYETNIDYGIKKLQQPATPMADYVSNVDYGVKKLQQSMTPKADYESNIDYGLKKLQQSTTPIADYESNVDFGLKKLTGPKTPKADYESKVDYAVKKLQQPMTPMADYETNIDYGIKKLQQSTTPIADYESNVDYGVKKLQQPMTPKADYESNVDFGLKKLTGPETPKADYESKVDYAVKKLQQPMTPMPDYESNIDFALKKLQKSITPEANYETNVSGLHDLFFNKDENNQTPKHDEFETPIKLSKFIGCRKRGVLKTQESQQKDQNRRITRSARKINIKLEDNEAIRELKSPKEKSTKSKKTSNITTRRRRRNVVKDEIALLIDSDDDSNILDIKQLTKLAAADCSDSNQHVNDFRKAARTRSRGNNRIQVSAEERIDSMNIMELADEHLLDAIDESKKNKLSKNTRKRKATNSGKSLGNQKVVCIKKTASNDSRRRTARKNLEHEESLDSMIVSSLTHSSTIDSDNKENKKAEDDKNQASRTQRRCKVKLPDVDYCMKLESETNTIAKQEYMIADICEPFGKSNLKTTMTSQNRTRVTRSRAKQKLID